jgi:hypothetical protein
VVLRSIERRLESLVEGVFARAFRSGLRPVELGRKLMREMDDHRSVGVSGGTVVPNHYEIHLGPEDAAGFDSVSSSLVRELEELLREHARSEGYRFMGPLRVVLLTEDGRRAGTFAVAGRFADAGTGTGVGSLLMPGGERLVLSDAVTRVGRLPDCGVQLVDASVSRHHAELRARGEGWVVADLGSTNGTRVNGVRVDERELRDGDEVRFGTVRVQFTAS